MFEVKKILLLGFLLVNVTVIAQSVHTAGVMVNGSICTNLERRVFGDGEAVRYRLPDGVSTVLCERTEWRIPADAKVWYQPECPEYEHAFVATTVGKITVGTRINLPITVKLTNGEYRLLTEANIVDYTDSSVEYVGDGRFAIRYYADAKGFVRSGVSHTPWRVTLMAKDLQTLATSDIIRRLCPPPSEEVAAACAKFVKPGRCIWQWLPDNSPKYAEQKSWYDRTKALGFEYYLIDDGWRDWRDGEMNQWACLKKWIDYGKSIGVGTFIWVHSNEMLSAVTRRPYLEKVKAAGAVGIKIDFVPPASCDIMRWYEETLAETLEFGLMTDFHGAVKPSGREKTWPHEIAREAIRGHEWHITRYNRVLSPEHDCILPFNRLVQGPADYTPMVLAEKELQGYTWARELAQGIVFSAPFLCFGDYPQNYLSNPAVELIKALPAVYDETRILPGSEIGECIAVAKRKGKDWFIAVENGVSERKLSIGLDFLGASRGELVGFADIADRPFGYATECRAVKGSDTIKLTVRPSGGYAAWIRTSADIVSSARPAPRPTLVNRIRSGVEVYGIVHWGLNTFTDREWGFGDENPADLNPEKFNADQIVGACRDGGLQGLIVVAKHHDGFCLWPTKTTAHNIMKSPFRGGKGDYVKEMEQACRKYGLKFGVYVSPWDRNNALYGTEKYVTDVFQAQIRELLSGDYGEIFEMWFDGANGGDGYYGGAQEERKISSGYYRYETETFAMVRKLQPNVCIFNESDLADFRFSGNEQGIVDPDSRSTGGHYDGVWDNYRKWANTGCVDGTTFHPIEADFPLRPGWFYHVKDRGKTKCAAYLMQRYLATVGNAATLNLGIAPNKGGLLDEEDVKSLRGFGDLQKLFFAHPAKDDEPFNIVVMTEDVSAGEHVDAWTLMADGKELQTGRSIGIKRIRVLDDPVTADKVVVKATSTVGVPVWVSLARYLVDPEIAKMVVSATTESGETDTAKWMTAGSQKD